MSIPVAVGLIALSAVVGFCLAYALIAGCEHERKDDDTNSEDVVE